MAGARERRAWRLLAVALVMLLLLALPWSRQALLAADARLLHEGLKDLRTRVDSDEDWRFAPLPAGLDYGWLAAAGRPPRIAHAMGASQTADANTLGAFDASLRAGLRVVEIDLWLDDQGRLRCHHGPPGPAPWRQGDCSFEQVLQRAVVADVYLVLDLKTAFESAGARVVAAIPDDVAARHVVFQLYEPAHVVRYAEWRQRRALAGPMVTAYRARRAVNHVIAGATGAGVRAFTLPVERMAALSLRPAGVQIFVHPAHDCATVQAAREAGINGVFVLSSTVCPDGGAP